MRWRLVTPRQCLHGLPAQRLWLLLEILQKLSAVLLVVDFQCDCPSAPKRITLKYIGLSYFICSVPPNAHDRILSNQMAGFTIHVAMAGRTDLLVGLWDNNFVEVPIKTAVQSTKRVEVEGDLRTGVMLSMGWPCWPVTD
ncbi:MAG: hypothetical protein MK179_20065 [Pirellulaceae bacterium]|nr:hypothetical protein [Pirellulaceae bacterium]